MTAIHAPMALLPHGWAADVRITVDARGDIAAVEPGAAPSGATRLKGPVIPGMPDLHSHAFQRAMAGLAERVGPAGDDFWSWRDVMYRFNARLGPDDVEAIAAQLYVELLKGGYTAVAEFHYLHNDPDGRAYADPAEMAERIVAAASTAGIRLTLLPVLYQNSGFGGMAPSEGQRRFVLPTDRFLAMVEGLAKRHRKDPNIAIGIAPHSLRAVTPDPLRAVLAAVPPSMPVHIHVAEQSREVENCLAWSRLRPVEWLLERVGLDERWCLVHATHMTAAEAEGLAASQAVACICPSTEGNLGDGLFHRGTYLEAEGRLAIGSDSNVCTNAFEELRWLEYGQRLALKRRNLVMAPEGSSTGRALWDGMLAGGSQALGQKVGAIEVGRRADLLVLDAEHPTLVGRNGDQWLDGLIFSGGGGALCDVLVGGRFAIKDRRHPREARIAAAYRRAIARLD